MNVAQAGRTNNYRFVAVRIHMIFRSTAVGVTGNEATAAVPLWVWVPAAVVSVKGSVVAALVVIATRMRLMPPHIGRAVAYRVTVCGDFGRRRGSQSRWRRR
jgi:hypothetical protein